MNASCADAGRARLEDWAKVPDPGWDRKGTDTLMSAAWSVNANSAWTKAYTEYWCPGHAGIKVIYYGAPAAGEARTWAGRSLPWPYILCVARLGEYKGIDVLAMAFAEVASRVEGVRLVLAGADHSEGRLFPFLDKLGIRERVVWLGQQSHARVLELMRGSLFCVLPSRRESLGGAVIEAMAAGKAVVASRTGGIPELVTHGRSGLLMAPKDPAALARAMLRLLADPAERETMGRAGREKSGLFSWQGAIDAYAQEWRSHPSWRPGGGVGFAVWDSGSDQTGGAISGSVMEVLRRRRQPFALCCWRSAPGEPFREDVPGGVLYRLGAPGPAGKTSMDPLVVAAQLGRVTRAERIAVWHFLVIRYQRLRGLLGFLKAAKVRPVVTLA